MALVDAVLLRRARNGVDAYGADVWTSTELPLPGCPSWPAERSELVNDGDRSTIRLNLVVPPGTAVAVTDQFRIAGLVYDVDGPAWDWTSALTGWQPGVIVPLNRTEG